MFRGVYPVSFDSTDISHEVLSDLILQAVNGKMDLNVGDKLILTHGDIMETVGASNTLKVLVVTEKHLS